jgi:hypothetical protein
MNKFGLEAGQLTAGRDAGRHLKQSLSKVDADLRAAFLYEL